MWFDVQSGGPQIFHERQHNHSLTYRVLYAKRSLLDFSLVVIKPRLLCVEHSFTPHFYLGDKEYLSQSPKKWFILSMQLQK